MENKLLELFKVKTYEELDKFIEENPEDPRVKDLNTFFLYYIEKQEKSKLWYGKLRVCTYKHQN